MKTAENHVRRKSLFKLEGLWKAFALRFPQVEDMKKHRVCLESAGRVPVRTGAWWPLSKLQGTWEPCSQKRHWNIVEVLKMRCKNISLSLWQTPLLSSVEL